jgi:hypothetical protein
LQQFGVFELPREQFQQRLAVALAKHADILPGELDKPMVAALLTAIQTAEQLG